MIQLKSIYEPIRRDLEEVEKVVFGVVRELEGHLGSEVGKTLSPKGKRLRPALLILSSRAVGGRADVSRPAAAVELVHSAALLHDDVVDHALTRRGEATASAKVGRSLSVVLGNYLYSKAFGLVPNSNGIRYQLSSATTSMCSGEALELERRGDISVSVGDYVHIAGKKTSFLISACCAMGARLGAADARTANDLGAYGLLLGLAFQIRDDCIDLSGGTMTTGKGGLRDFAERNATLPLILALPRMTEADRKRVRAMFRGEIQLDVHWLVEKVEGHGGIAESMSLASEYSDRAVRCLTSLEHSQAKASLQLLAAYSVERAS